VLEETESQKVSRYIADPEMLYQDLIQEYLDAFELGERQKKYITIRDATTNADIAPGTTILLDTVVYIYYDLAQAVIDDTPLGLGREVILLKNRGKIDSGTIGTVVRIVIDNKNKTSYMVEFPIGNPALTARVMQTTELNHNQMGLIWDVL